MTGLRSQSNAMTSVQRAHAHHRKTCAAVTCCERVTIGRIFCPNHWFALPKWLRNSIIQTFRDAEWPQHQDAIRQAADYIDAAVVEAREEGFTHVYSMPVAGSEDRAIFMGRSVR